MFKCIQIVSMCWGWPKLCVAMWFVKWVTAAAGRGGGPAGGAQRPPFLCARAACAAGLEVCSPPRCSLMFVNTCLALMKGSLLIAAFINISCSTKGRKTRTQTTGEGSKSGGEETSKQGLWKPVQHDDTYFDLMLFILGGLQSHFQSKVKLKLDLFADDWG